MKHSLHHIYVGPKNNNLREVYWAMSVHTFAFGLLAIFVPIYLYGLGFSLRQILFFYTTYYIFSSASEYVAGRLASRFGVNHIFSLSFPLTAIGLFFLLTIHNLHWHLWLLALAMAFPNGLFWVPYDDEFSKSKHKKTAGSEIGKLAILVSLFGALAPMIGGIVAEQFGFSMVIVICMCLLLAAMLPIFKRRDMIKKEPLNMRAFLAKDNIKNAIAYGGYGFEGNASNVVWPLFLFLIVGEYKQVGFIATMSLLAAIIVTLFIGKMSDKHDKKKLLKTGTFLNFSTGVGRTVVTTASAAYVASMLSAISHIFVFIPFISKFFLNADRDRRTEYVVGMEMSTDFIRAIYFLILFGATFFFGNALVLTIGIALGAAGVFLTTLINNSGQESGKNLPKQIKTHREIAKARI